MKTTKKRAVAPIRGTIRLRGRDFSRSEQSLIRKLVKKHFKRGRTFASVEICKALDWRQPNGWLKDRACRQVLRMLEAKGIIRLPKSKQLPTKKKVDKKSGKARDILRSGLELDARPILSLDLRRLRFIQVKGTKDEPLWNALVGAHHYLGFKISVGRTLKYLVYSDDRIVAALGFSDPAWAVASRDKLLAEFGFEVKDIRMKCINNVRFLIMPWVRVENLASCILSAAVIKVARDWNDYYAIAPEIVETFVDGSRFKGSCYKAANWLYLGDTKGYRKSGSIHHNSQASKMIFLYPLKYELRVAIAKGLGELRNGVPNPRTDI